MATALVFCKSGAIMKELAVFLEGDASSTGADAWDDTFGSLKTKTYAGARIDHWVDVVVGAIAAGTWTEPWRIENGKVVPSSKQRDASDWVKRKQNETLAELRAAKGDADDLKVLICTDKLKRAVDIPNLGCVINFGLPRVWEGGRPGGVDAETYTQRIGRVGRADLLGCALTIVTPEDKAELAKLVTMRHQPGKFEPKIFPLEKDAAAKKALRREGNPEILQAWISEKMVERKVRGRLLRSSLLSHSSNVDPIQCSNSLDYVSRTSHSSSPTPPSLSVPTGLACTIRGRRRRREEVGATCCESQRTSN